MKEIGKKVKKMVMEYSMNNKNLLKSNIKMEKELKAKKITLYDIIYELLIYEKFKNIKNFLNYIIYNLNI